MALGLGFPLHVATAGLLAVDPLSVATEGIITSYQASPSVVAHPNVPPNNVGSSLGPANKDFWVRENALDVPFGPLTFYAATYHARYISQLPEKSGTAEIIIYVGSRPGDPVMPPKLTVVYVYVRGNRMLGGRAATFQSEKDS